MSKSYSNTFVARIPAPETQCQQGKCASKARFIKRFIHVDDEVDKTVRSFRFCSKHLPTKIAGYVALDFNLISQ